MHATQGDVLLPSSTLKRTDAQSVLLNWTQSKVKQTDKQMSAEGGQATNSLLVAGFLSLLICVRRFAANMDVSRET